MSKLRLVCHIKYTLFPKWPAQDFNLFVENIFYQKEKTKKKFHYL